MFRQKKYPEALEQYSNTAALQPKEKGKIAAAFHNIGNSFLSDKKYEDAIKSYEKALKNNPKDNDTRYNLAYAQAQLKKQQEKEKNKDKNKKDDKQDQNKPDPKPKEQPQQPKAKPQPQQPQMSKQNAQQILDALQQDEKNAQDKAKKQQARGTIKSDIDW